jgi:uncharacterized membrane protein YdbT with pleckstrin-like domain
MSYIQENLMTGESVVYCAHLHWAVYLRPIILGILSILVCFADLEIQFKGAAMAVFLLLVLPMLLSVWIRTKTSEFAVTNKRIMIKTGLFRRSSLEILLTKVEGIIVHQSISGRIFDFGTILVSGTGGAKTPYPNIAAPMRFRREVQEQIEKISLPVLR